MYHKGKTEFEIPYTAIVIKSRTKWHKSKFPLTFDQQKVLFEECSEGHVRNYSSQMCAPLLCLFTGCHLMVTKNIDIPNGITNRTTCKFKKVILKAGVKLQRIKIHGYWINDISTEDVEQIEVEWLNCDHFMGKFRLTTNIGTLRVKYPISEFGIHSQISTSIELQHLPVIVNHATTGHKLQGKTVDSLVIEQWARTKNWAYVVFSRVRKLSGLFLARPIPDDLDFLPAFKYLDMMTNL
jgi:hypothetical protein